MTRSDGSDGLRDSECQYHLRHNSLVPRHSNIQKGAIFAKFYTWPGNEVGTCNLHSYMYTWYTTTVL